MTQKSKGLTSSKRNEEEKRNILVTRSEGIRQLQLNEGIEHFHSTKDINLEKKWKHPVEKMFKTKRAERSCTSSSITTATEKDTQKMVEG